MLHILGLLLKIIGIILLAVLGILVLLILVVLFSAIQCRLSGSCEGKPDSLKVDAKITWLFHLIRAEIHVSGSKVSYQVKAAWKTLASETEAQEETPAESSEDSEALAQLMEELTAEEEAVPQPQTCTQTSAPRLSDQDLPDKDAAEPVQSIQKPAKDTAKPEEKQKLTEKFRKLTEKIRAWFEKIKYTFQQFCDKIKVLLQKKETLMAFIEHPVHQSAFQKTVAELVRFLKMLKPDKIKADVVFGFSDPYYTGKVLAFLGVLYPFLGDTVSVTPDFEEKIFKGSFFLKGHFRICHPVMTGIRLLMDKNIRMTIKHIRKLKL